METLAANLKSKPRRAKLLGRDYLIAPATLVVPGVLNGSQGPLLYTPDDLASTHDSWNMMPLVAGHPVVNGQHVSARSPNVLNEFGLGFLFGSVFNADLSAEAWFDEEATRRVDNRILAKLDRGDPIEVSTGLFTVNEPAPAGATHEGVSYSHVARHLRPDHLAILMDAPGACSTARGCGVNPTANEAACPHCGGSMSPKCEKCGYATNAPPQTDNNKPSPPAVEIVNVNKQQMIDRLVANCACWKGKAETLNALAEADVKGILDAHEDAEKATLASNTLVANLRAELDAAKQQAPAARLTAEEQATLNWAHAERAKQKALLVDRLLVNITDPAARQAKGTALMKKDEAELKELLELIPQQTANVAPAFDFSKPLSMGGPVYFGPGGYVGNQQIDDDPDDMPPVINIDYPDPRVRRQA